MKIIAEISDDEYLALSDEEIDYLNCRPGFRAELITLGLISFGDETCDYLRVEMNKANLEFAFEFPSYMGQALHAFTPFEEVGCKN